MMEEAMSATSKSQPLPDLFGAVYMDDADDDENSPQEEAKRAKGSDKGKSDCIAVAICTKIS